MKTRGWTPVAAISMMLLFFSVPHILEDFALGEPAKRGISPTALGFVVSSLLAVQFFGVYCVAQRKKLGLGIHAALGLLWPVLAGVAQLPEILRSASYRRGIISVMYVIGVIVFGAALLLASVLTLRAGRVRVQPPSG